MKHKNKGGIENKRMEQFVYLQPNSLPTELCEEIIQLFEKETEAQYLGVTGGGYRKDVKNTLDLSFPEMEKNGCKYYQPEHANRWTTIKNVLYKELTKNLKKYIVGLKEQFNTSFFKEQSSGLTDNGFLIHKYFKEQGKFTRHQDFMVKEKKHRVIVYLWYLNDVEEGGETQVFHHMKIKPEAGKLLMFPAQWCFPHCGIMPLSGDKFVVTGWLHLPNDES